MILKLELDLENGVLEIMNRNKTICEPFGGTVDEAFEEFHANAHNLDAHGEQENDDVLDGLNQMKMIVKMRMPLITTVTWAAD